MNYSNEQIIRLRRILTAVAQRVKERVDSIDPVFNFKTGIEGWFKVEFVFALKGIGEEVVSLKNKGPDVILTKGLQIELKAASDFNPAYLRDGALKDKVPCIFLESGEKSQNIERLKSMNQIHIIDIIMFSGVHKWAVGCLIPGEIMNGYKRNKREESHKSELHKQGIEFLLQDKIQISSRLRNLNPRSSKMAGKLDEILAIGGTWQELIAKAKIESQKINGKIKYTSGVINAHIKYRRVDQKKTEYLRNYIINDVGIFPPKTKK